jgi:hypothetical protein
VKIVDNNKLNSHESNEIEENIFFSNNNKKSCNNNDCNFFNGDNSINFSTFTVDRKNILNNDAENYEKFFSTSKKPNSNQPEKKSIIVSNKCLKTIQKSNNFPIKPGQTIKVRPPTNLKKNS